MTARFDEQNRPLVFVSDYGQRVEDSIEDWHLSRAGFGQDEVMAFMHIYSNTEAKLWVHGRADFDC